MKIKNIKIESTKTLVRVLKSFIETIVLSIIYYMVWDNAYNDGLFPLYQFKGKYVLMGVYAVIFFAICNNIDGFRFGDLSRLDLALAQWISLLITNFVTYFQLSLIENNLIHIMPIIVLTLAQIFISTTFVFIFSALYRLIYPPHRMIMVFGTDNAIELKIKIDSRRDKYRIRKLISVDEGYEKICEEILNYESVVLNDVPAQIRNDILKFCYKNAIRCYVVPKITDVMLKNSKDINLFDTPIFMVKGTGLSLTQRFFKRLFDIFLCLIALVVASPIMLIIALAIKIEDGGPVFFKQDRVTYGGRVFEILKFRSMIVDAEKSGISIPATGDDPRITKVGKVIRALRVDELPQIINILKGDMSIVGPRPERVEHVEEYTKQIPEFEFRLKVKGGLTGYAQIYGKYNTNPYDKLRMDMLYIEHYSFFLDLKLILTTIRIMFSKNSTEGFEKAEENKKKTQELIEKQKSKKE